MKQNTFTSVLLSLFLMSFITGPVKKTCQFENNEIKCTYETTDGRLEGSYVSYYKNGQKKAEGSFLNNYRTGTWKVWDKDGVLKAERNYENPLSIKRIVPSVTTENPDAVQYPLVYNKEGYVEMFFLEESFIVWTYSCWRFIPAENNNTLFKEDRLFNILQKNIANKNIAIYSTVDDEFSTSISGKDIPPSYNIIIGYRLKELDFYDNQRQVFESRIIGICPMLRSAEKNDTIAAYWIYYPAVRNILAQEKIAGADVPANIKTLDDLFFFRYFSSKIEKEPNYPGKRSKVNPEKAQIFIIETEHDSWMNIPIDIGTEKK
jgi:hypothetical protein